jgi:anti-sigma factor RsiW
MHHLNHHPTDAELLLAMDGELPVEKQGGVESHVARCVACRTRQTVIEETLADAIAADRPAPPFEQTGGNARARLERRLEGESESGFAPTVRWVLAGGFAAAALVLLLQWPQASNLAPRAGEDEGIENALPAASLTPGATTDIVAGDLCDGRRSSTPIAASVRRQVLREYEMENVPENQYELDYLITPELGGAPDARNLWPQRYASRKWNAHVKDELERLLPRLVCGGQIDLTTAQRDIARDWIAAYRKYFKTSEPLETHASLEDDDDPTPLTSHSVETHRGMQWFNRDRSRNGYWVRLASY